MSTLSTAAGPRPAWTPGRRLRLELTAVVVALALSVIASCVGTTEAKAATGKVYVAFPTWLGNAPNGGQVVAVWAMSGDLWATPASGDWGDDRIYPTVRFNSNNTIVFKTYCQKTFWRSYWTGGWSSSICPTRFGQTFWLGPWGQSHN
ncbi:MAG: hypothetical protein NTX16_12515 [Actinobacteria bacterium]|nr:hypothetical protein [Actinomycetota bacterium]